MSMVEWRKIGDICEIIRGNGVQKTDFVEDGVGCIHYGQIYTHYGPFTYSTNKFVSKETFEKARKASKGDIVMTDTSENVEDICKSVAYLGEDDIAVSNHALILKHNQNPKFLSYSTLTNSFLDQKRKFVVGVKVSGIKPEQLAKIKIYLPSLSEQNRIVGILDTFTSSIENLKEQIALRRKQYEYYRDQLLDLEGKDGVEMKTIGDLCDTLSGFPFDSSQFSETGIRLMRGMNVKRGCFDFSEDINKYWVNSVGLEKYLLNENDIIISMDGSLVGHSFCYLKKEHLPLLLVQRVARIRTTENFKFIYYNIAKSFPDYVDKKKTAGAIPHISMKDINGFTIPVPSPDEQQRIVGILDVFEESIQNLEAQLVQREKQYEYYRNKLLTFE